MVRVLNRLKEQRGLPKMLFCDNGSEFTGQLMDLWAYRNGVKIDFSRPGKPTDNAFNGTFRAECLYTNWFQSLPEASKIIELWRREYNESRPHRALAHRMPTEFASQIAASRDLAETKTGRELTILVVQIFQALQVRKRSHSIWYRFRWALHPAVSRSGKFDTKRTPSA